MSDRAPRFSVIIPCYNGAQVIATALRTVQAQTFRDFEVVICNDGSTDESLAVIDRFTSDLPLRVISRENGGLGAARNTAIAHATGTYVAFLDADDAWDPTKLERVHAAILEVDADLVCHDERFVKDGRVVRHATYGPHSTYSDLLLKGNCLSPSAVTVRRACVLAVGGFSEDRHHIHGVEDYDLWMRLAANGARFQYLHEELGAYRLHDANMSNAADFNSRELWLIESHFRSLDQSAPAIRRAVRLRRGAYYASLGLGMLRRKRLTEALRAYGLALRYRATPAVLLKYAVAGPLLWALQSLRMTKLSEGGSSD